MPKATQPDFRGQRSRGGRAPRTAPKNSKVDVLQDVEMLVHAA